MSWHILFNLFLSGIFLGGSVCAIYCGWIFLPVLFERQQNKKKSLLKFILFHSGKIFSYTIIGGLVGYSSSFISFFRTSKVSLLSGAFFFFLIGLLNILMPEEFRVKMKKVSACFSG
ncbi:MAG: sulfite exporter TauE/SafE family protein, partial [Candidatus Omnitrophica bacterium]|nr:sulfite exporter TauE/SafE family protein [Candidatus Omnitrophota bacterium]